MINSHALNWQIKMGKQNFFCLLALKYVILTLLVTSVKSEECYVRNNNCSECTNNYRSVFTCAKSSDSGSNISLKIIPKYNNFPKEVVLECNKYQEDNYTEFLKGLNVDIISSTAVIIRYCPVPNIPFTDFLNMQNVQTLFLENMTKGFRLQPYHFQKLNRSSIERLIIEIINAKHLPEQLFEHMSNLKILELNVDQCATLPAKIFESLKQLEFLSIRCNNLTFLETEIFERLENLKELKIEDTPLQYLPASVFSSLRNLKSLTLQNTNISSLQNPIFDNLCELDHLFIRHNSRLTHLSENLLKNKPKLLQISITNNEKLSNLPETLFHNLTSTRFISLSDNQLTNLTESHFKRTRLFTLELQRNNLTENSLKSLKENLKSVQIFN